MEDDLNITWNMQIYIKYAQGHDVTVQRYGRFPTRNAALGRKSTPKEVEYLKTADSHGQ